MPPLGDWVLKALGSEASKSETDLYDTLKGLGFLPEDLCISVLLVADYEPSVDKLLKFVHVADITKHPRAVVIPHPRWFADRYAKAAFDAAASTSTFASFFN